MVCGGLEIDLQGSRKKSQIDLWGVGILTFSVPPAWPVDPGTTVWLTTGVASVLIGSLLASHTLLGLPHCVAGWGWTRENSVTVTVGARTIF